MRLFGVLHEDAPTVVAVVDTCVLLDFLSAHDFVDVGDRAVERATDAAGHVDLFEVVRDPKVRWRRERARDAAHLFLHFDARGLRTYSLTEELLRTLEKRVPIDGGTISTHYATIVAHLVLTRLLKPCGIGPRVPIGLSGNAADSHLVEEARSRGVPLVTMEWNDKPTGIRAKALAAGVEILRPRDYLDRAGVDATERDRLARRFLARFERKARSYRARFRRNSPHRRALLDVRGYYQLILFGDTTVGRMP